MRITADPISTEAMQNIDAHCSATKTTREEFAVAAIESAAKDLKPAKEEPKTEAKAEAEPKAKSK